MRQQHFATNKYTYEGLVKRLKINTHKTVTTTKTHCHVLQRYRDLQYSYSQVIECETIYIATLMTTYFTNYVPEKPSRKFR